MQHRLIKSYTQQKLKLDYYSNKKAIISLGSFTSWKELNHEDVIALYRALHEIIESYTQQELTNANQRIDTRITRGTVQRSRKQRSHE